jgi:tetrahydromethanopterin S-methyltransferase subunit G
MADVTTTFAAKDENFAKTVDSLQKRLDGFGKKMESVNKSMSNIGGAIGGGVAKLAGLAAGFIAVQSAIGAFREAIDLGGNLAELSDRTGETAGNLMILQRAFENSGAGADSVGPQLNRLQKFMYAAKDATSEQGKALASLGLSYSDLNGKFPIQQMQMLAEKISAVQDPGQRAALAMSVFGKSGGELLPLLRGMTAGLDQARAQLGSAPRLADELSRQLDTVGENFRSIGRKGSEFALGLLKKITPALLEVTTQLANIDAAGFGEKLSGYLKKTLAWTSATFGLSESFKNVMAAINAIMGGDFGAGFSLMFETAIVAGKNAINVLIAAAMAALSTIGSALRDIFTSKGGFLKLIDSTFSYLGNTLQSKLAGAMKAVMEQIPFMSQGAIDSMGKIASEAQSVANGFKMKMGTAIGQIGQDIKNAIVSAPAEFADAYEANMKDPLFEIEEQSKKNADEAKRLKDNYEAAAEAAKTAATPPALPTPPPMEPEPTAAPTPAPTSSGGGRTTGRAGARMSEPKTALEALKAGTEDTSVSASMRIQDKLDRDMARAQKLRSRGSYGAAASAMRRATAAAERRAKSAISKAGLDDRRLMQGMMTGEPSEIKNQQGKAEASTVADKASDPLIQWLEQNIYKWMQDNLPSNALT